MANYADCRLVTDAAGNSLIVAVTSSRPDGLPGSYYTLHTPDGSLIGSGFSAGYMGTGSGSAHSALKNGRAAARRWLAAEAEQAAQQAEGVTA